MTAAVQAPAMDAEETIRRLELHFTRWCISSRDGLWTATGRCEADEGLTLEAESAGELVMAIIWHQTQADIRWAIFA